MAGRLAGRRSRRTLVAVALVGAALAYRQRRLADATGGNAAPAQ